MRAAFNVHLRHSVFSFVVPLLTVAAAFVTVTSTSQLITSNALIADAVREVTGILAVLFAGFALWDGIREVRHGAAEVLQASPRPRAEILLVQMVCGVIAVSCTYALLLLVLYARGFIFLHIADAPLPLHILGCWLYCVFWCVWGYALAALAPTVWMLPCAVIPPLACSIAVSFGDLPLTLLGLLTLLSRSGNEFTTPVPLFFGGQVAFWLGLVATVLCLAVALSWRSRFLGAIFLIPALCLGIAGGVIVEKQNGVWGNPTPQAEIDRQLQTVSLHSGAAQLELLPSYQPVASEVAAKWERLHGLFAGTPAAFSRVRQNAETFPAETAKDPEPQVLILNPYSAEIGSESIRQTLQNIHTQSCYEMRGDAALVLDLWLADKAGGSDAQLREKDAVALRQLNSFSLAEGNALMRKHFAAWRDCSLRLSDIAEISAGG